MSLSGIDAPVSVVVETQKIYSNILQREVIVDLYMADSSGQNEVNLLLINDGQDLRKMQFKQLLQHQLNENSIRPIVCAGIHCSSDRIHEYGTAAQCDYMGRGAKAASYSSFVKEELLPYLQKYAGRKQWNKIGYAGFSLGGLHALDMVWNNPYLFSVAGVFSGALWWRSHGYDDPNYHYDTSRIMHSQIKKGPYQPNLRFFFECGALDETADRNNNGIIDAVEDTRDLVDNIKHLGYADDAICYVELPDGRHDVETWAKAFPAFLQWSFGESKS